MSAVCVMRAGMTCANTMRVPACTCVGLAGTRKMSTGTSRGCAVCSVSIRMGLGVNEMTTKQAREANERGYRAMLARLDGAMPDATDIIDMVTDLLVYAEQEGYADADEIVDRARVHARAEIDGDDLTTNEG